MLNIIKRGNSLIFILVIFSIICAVSAFGALKVTLYYNNTVIQSNSFNISFNITGDSDFYRCMPYISTPDFLSNGSQQGPFMAVPPEPPVEGAFGAEMEDPMTRVAKYRNGTLYNATLWMPKGNFTWNVMCEPVSTIELNISTVGGAPSLVYANGSGALAINQTLLKMGDIIKIYNNVHLANETNFLINVSLIDRFGTKTYSYVLYNSSYNLTSNATESLFTDFNNETGMMPPGCSAGNASYMCPPAGMLSARVHTLTICYNTTGVAYMPALNITVNPLLLPPANFSFIEGKPPMPTIRLGSGNFSVNNFTININGTFEPLFDFEKEVCSASNPTRPPFCNDISRKENDGFFFRNFEDCLNNADDDSDRYTDAQDADCFWLPNYNSSTSDNPTPKVLRQKATAFNTRVMFDFETDIMTNATITLYNYGTLKSGSNQDEYTCQNATKTIDEKGMGTSGFGGAFFVPFHHLEVTNILNGTTYYYDMQVCTKGNKCTKSYCRAVTTTNVNFSNLNFTFAFTPPVQGDFRAVPLIRLDVGGTESNLTDGGVINRTNVTIKLKIPEDNIHINFKGADFTGNYTLSLASAFSKTFANDNTTGRRKPIIAMNHTAWLDLVQNLNIDEIELTIPINGNNLQKCNDSGENCVDVTSKATKINSTSSTSTWTIPISLGFSSYTAGGAVNLTSPNQEYEVYLDGELINITMNSSAISDNNYNITVLNTTTNGAFVTLREEYIGGEWVSINRSSFKSLVGTTLITYRVNVTSMVNYNSTKAMIIFQIINSTNATNFANNFSIDIYGAVINTTPISYYKFNITNNQTPRINITVHSSLYNNATCWIVNASTTLLTIISSNYTTMNSTAAIRATNRTIGDGVLNYSIKCTNPRDDTYYSSGGMSNLVWIDTQMPGVTFVAPTAASGTPINANYTGVNVSASDDISMLNITITIYNSTTNSAGIINTTFNITNGTVYINNNSASQFFQNFSFLNDGTYFVNATARDAAGNVNYSNIINFTIDIYFPKINFSSLTQQSGGVTLRNTIDVNVTVVETNIINITINLYNSSHTLLNSSNSSTSPFFVQFSNLKDDVYYFNASISDVLANTNWTERRHTAVENETPAVTFRYPTDAHTTSVGRTYILVNVTASDQNITNVTIYFWNSTSINSTNMTTFSSYFLNYTNLSDHFGYYINATAFNIYGQMNSTTQPWWVYVDTSPAPASTPSSGGGGGSPSSTSKNIELSEAGSTQSIGVSERISFKYDIFHTITLIKIAGSKATISIASPLYTFELGIGQSASADLDGNGIKDIIVTLVNIANGKATLKVQKIAGATPATTTPTPTAAPKPAETPAPAPEEKPAEEPSAPAATPTPAAKKDYRATVVILLVLIILVAILYLKVIKPKHTHRKH